MRPWSEFHPLLIGTVSKMERESVCVQKRHIWCVVNFSHSFVSLEICPLQSGIRPTPLSRRAEAAYSTLSVKQALRLWAAPGLPSRPGEGSERASTRWPAPRSHWREGNMGKTTGDPRVILHCVEQLSGNGYTRSEMILETLS